MVSAGITQYGTLAAAEFLTNPEYFAQALKNAPRDQNDVWDSGTTHGVGCPLLVAQLWSTIIASTSRISYLFCAA